MKRHSVQLLAVLSFCVLAMAGGVAADDKGLAGTWEGAVIWRPADLEIDVVVDFAPDAKGGWSGRLAAPMARVEGHVLANVSVQGRSVSFEHTDRPARGVFRGTLSEDGGRIEGQFTQADGESTRFSLRRREATQRAAAAPEVNVFSGPEDLKALFNFDQDSPRLVLLLAPTCELCRVGARLTQRYVLDAVDAPSLRAYVVWLPMSDEDTREAARQAAVDLPDERVRHFWVVDLAIAQAFAGTLGMKSEPAWDVFLVYPPGATWSGENPPAPRFYMHRNGELPRELEYNGTRLAEAIRNALAK